MPQHAILVADRDRTSLNLIRRASSRLSCDVAAVRTAAEAMSRCREGTTRAAIVSLALHEEAFTLVKQMRQEFATSRIPILLLAREGEEEAVATGLELGALDYLVHPADEAEVGRRIARMFSWGSMPGHERYLKAAGVVLDVDEACLVEPRSPVPLTPCELEILRWLLTPPGRAYTRRQLLAAHRSSFPPNASDRTVDSHVASLRKKLGPMGARVVTLRGVGYRFDAESVENLSNVSA